eukprot:SAG31_NODE_25655_length_457_cov_0.835196_1_plen_21_part_01
MRQLYLKLYLGIIKNLLRRSK